MKLDYKILWLDDKINEFIEDEYDNELANHLINQGFNPIILTVFNEEDFFKVLDDSFDLILTDFHLNDDDKSVRNGDLIVSEVRRMSYFTEILFYSARAELTNISKLDRISFLETRKSTTREHQLALILKVKELIDLTIKKFQHIVTMRGMIMHETSSLDVEFHNILKIVVGNNENAINKIKTRFKKFNSDSINEIDDNITLDNLLLKIGSSHRWKGLKENVKDGNIKTILNEYEKDIINIRNKFAHAILEKDENGREYFKYKEEGITFDEILCKKIRESILNHKENLDLLKIELDINV